MKYFVFYEDDYFECGGLGFEVFDDSEKAMSFINDRYQKIRNPDMEKPTYRIIEGVELNVVPKEFITKLVLEK